MFESLIDNLDDGNWEEIPCAQKNEDDFKTYHVNRNHVKVDDHTLRFLIAEEDGDGINALIKMCKPNKDPLKDIGQVELKVKPDGDTWEIVAIDLNGDIVAKKGA